ncbi:MAG: biotin--[acetyl-CoA-carboxylase] ligase [Desulfurivibrionaceae bacterium]
MIIDEGWRKMIEQGALAGFPVRFLERTGSTNQVAIDMAKNGAPTDTVVAAESQTGGRGRLGRSWHSPAGSGLYFSMIMRPALPPEDLSKITLAAGLALCLAALLLKWPNDLFLEGRKLGGILAETVNIEGGPTAVVLGIGLNVNAAAAAFPADLQDRATSLLIETGREYCRSEMLAAIVAELQRQVRRFERSGFKGILDDWRKRDLTLGRELTWLIRNGGVVRGVSLGPDDSGQLLIKDADGKIHEVLSGDISLGPVHE